MIDKETHIRTIGYGAMLSEGLVGVTTLIAASALSVAWHIAGRTSHTKVSADPHTSRRLYDNGRYAVQLKASEPEVMPLFDLLMGRRDAVTALASTAALSFICGCSREGTPMRSANPDTDAFALLDEFAENLLRLYPESATSLGIDVDARAPLRSQLTDRTAEGRQRIANQLRADLERANSFNTSELGYAMRTSFEVVRSAYATALEGFALPYGDVAVGGWRNTPYVVIQNVGAYLDIPDRKSVV